MSYQNAPPYTDEEAYELQEANMREIDSSYSFDKPMNKTGWRAIVGTPSELTQNWRHTLRELWAEWWGTMLFVYVGTGSVISSMPTGTGGMDAPTVLLVAMGFGFGIATMIYATANISGGHLNPAVTISIVVVRKMTIIKGACFIVAQCLGAIVGSALLKLSLPQDLCEHSGYGATVVANNTPLGDSVHFVLNVGWWGGFVMEYILTFLLVFTIFATASLPGDNKDMGKFAPLSIGFAVLVCHIVGIPYTGPSMNPARSLGPAIVGGVWDRHLVFWVGPILGGVSAGLVYNYGLSDSAEKSKAVSNVGGHQGR